MIIVSAIDDENYTEFTINKWKEEESFRLLLSGFFKSIKIGFDKIEITEEEQLIKKLLPDSLPNGAPNEMKDIFNDLKNLKNKIEKLKQLDIEEKDISINFFHKKTDEAGKFLDFINIDFSLQSKGTQKLFNIFGLWIDAIENNKVLVIDELDAGLHTLLTIELIKIFHSNKNQHAQLIFASHDTNLLRKDLFRRDQIWFTEKDMIGATDLYSLVEYKINQATVRNDASFEKDYLLGKYGAIPFLGDFNQILKTENDA